MLVAVSWGAMRPLLPGGSPDLLLFGFTSILTFGPTATAGKVMSRSILKSQAATATVRINLGQLVSFLRSLDGNPSP